jgi:hypothetical protein
LISINLLNTDDTSLWKCRGEWFTVPIQAVLVAGRLLDDAFGGNEQVIIILMELSEILRSQKSFLVARKVRVAFWRRLLSCFHPSLRTRLLHLGNSRIFFWCQPVLHPPAAITWFKYYHGMIYLLLFQAEILLIYLALLFQLRPCKPARHY